MNFLGIDTSADYLTVVAQKGERVYTRFLHDCARKHSELLMQEIDAAFKALDMRPKDCDFFAATVGPGSFTGIRIGIATIKGLCLSAEKKALAITSFDTLAYAEKDEKLLCVVDAGHSAVYACGYDKRQVVLPPVYCTRDEALCKDGFKLVDCNCANPAQGLLQAIVNKSGEIVEAETLTALYLRKSSAEENAK